MAHAPHCGAIGANVGAQRQQVNSISLCFCAAGLCSAADLCTASGLRTADHLHGADLYTAVYRATANLYGADVYAADDPDLHRSARSDLHRSEFANDVRLAVGKHLHDTQARQWRR